jgi:nucleoside-diphosphate-sugar epimerase
LENKGATINILLTGGLGYIGSELTKKLLSYNHTVTVLDIGWFGNYLTEHPNLTIINQDLRDFNESLNGFNIVIHLAGIANDPGVELNPSLSWEINVLSTFQLLQNAIKSRVEVFIFASSGSVYGVSPLDRVTEYTETLPISTYNKTKMIAEQVVLASGSKIRTFCIRPATVCGPSVKMRLDLAVNQLTYQALRTNKIMVLGGKQYRPNIHMKDMVDVYIHFVNSYFRIEPGIYNAGFQNLTIEEIANLVSSEVPSKIEFRNSTDARSYRLDSSKLLETGFMPNYSVINAICELKSMYLSGLLVDDDNWHTVRTLKKIGLN